jgi:Xaa-Pro aminopeptidase
MTRLCFLISGLFLALFLSSFLLPSNSFAQTPEQAYFDWTSLPFSKEELAGRRNNLVRILDHEGIEGLLLIPSRDGFSSGETFRQLDDFYYFTGLELPNSILVIDLADKSVVLFTPARDLRFESASRPNDFPGRALLADPAIAGNSGLILKNMEDFSAFVAERTEQGGNILINSGRAGPVVFASDDYITTHSPIQVLMEALAQKHGGLTFQNIYSAIARIRMIKSPAEIERLRRAADITVSGIKTAAGAIRAGVDERYLEGVLEGAFKRNGAQRPAFGSIIKSGPNSLWPWRILATHYNRNNRILENGELVIFDVGSEYDQYVSDVGRTFPVSGHFSKAQKEILEMETAIADQVIAFIRPGITFSDLRAFTDRIIPQNAREYMQVGLFFGHHLGLSTGDPNLGEALLKPGMIFTVEPWYYNHDDEISVFTEDMILVTEQGAEVLTRDLPRTPEELENLMRGSP